MKRDPCLQNSCDLVISSAALTPAAGLVLRQKWEDMKVKVKHFGSRL